jgi:hypothetical protein
MKGFIRTLLPASLVLCALVGSIPASASAQVRAHTMVRRTSMGARILCNDGMWGYANRGGCANHDGVAVRQPTYTTNPVYATNVLTPRASARARARANSHSAVAGGTYSNTVRLHATAKCNDGTYWHSTRHRGACDAHGGVARWF